MQTDTSLAIEAKMMRRWEFESIDEAATNMFQWFSGSKSERPCLREYLDPSKGIISFHKGILIQLFSISNRLIRYCNVLRRGFS